MNIVIFIIFDFISLAGVFTLVLFHLLLGFLCFLSLPISVWSCFGYVI